MTPISADGPGWNSGGPHRPGPPESTLRLTAVVNGTPADVRPHPDTPLLDVVREALDQTHNRGRAVEEWTVTNALGRLLDTSRLVREYGLEDGDTLFIQVAVGAGGDTSRGDLEDHESGEVTLASDASGRLPPRQLVDPEVSKRKFDWELGHFLQSEAVQRRRGILVVRAGFPQVLLAFAMPERPPTPIVFGALIDYTDYDHSAPSIALVDPFTERPYQPGEMPTALMRRVVMLKDTGGHSVLVSLIPRLAGAPLSICVPGTRHYYEHPAVGSHAWAAARVRDAGGLTALVDQLRAHVIEAMGDEAFSAHRAPETVERREF